MTKAIFHFHLFKNAGTSLDASFKENFEAGTEWVTDEFPANPARNREMVKQWVENNRSAKCFSSHTAQLPLPDIDSFELLPVIFIRHPIDRIASAYSFERKQGGSGFGSVLARNTSLKGYIESRIALGYDRQCKNFHTERFAYMFGAEHGSELDRAKMAVEQLPFVGLVENFNESLQKLESWLIDEGFEGINIAPKVQNVSRDTSKSIDEKVAEIRDEIGEEAFEFLVQNNQDDFELYELAKQKFSE
ncbi:sulfotransferase family 2 domain-containing protein [Alteromonas portus]|uniref:sulfotransferase family 2 domain-containing protein n=1 Tax=Alteromonas portus TaxID=2565549 RepID=UPI003BF7F537